MQQATAAAAAVRNDAREAGRRVVTEKIRERGKVKDELWRNRGEV